MLGQCRASRLNRRDAVDLGTKGRVAKSLSNKILCVVIPRVQYRKNVGKKVGKKVALTPSKRLGLDKKIPGKDGLVLAVKEGLILFLRRRLCVGLYMWFSSRHSLVDGLQIVSSRIGDSGVTRSCLTGIF